jgi:hypothetical protein
MKHWYFILSSIFIISCTQQEDRSAADSTTVNRSDTFSTKDPSIDEVHVHGTDTVDVYSNQRFKNVYVEKLNDTSFRITGKAQVFEAAFSWVVEDGHNELLSGHGMTDAGAPEFGNFSFVVNVKKQRANSTLHLILFESSPKDGSRQYELPVPLN